MEAPMDSQKAIDAFRAMIEGLVDAKLKPVLERLVGLECAIVHVFSMLDQRQVMTLEEASASLQEAIEQATASIPASSRQTLHEIRALVDTRIAARGFLPPKPAPSLN